MGSNVSTSSETKEAKAIATPKPYIRSDGGQGIIVSPEKDEMEAANRIYKNSNEDQSNVIEIIRPVSFLNHSVNINRVISFHSSAGWRDYFQFSKHSDKPIVIFFSASWCGFCRYMEPILDDFTTRYTDVEIHKIDVDQLFEISREFRVTVMPTFVFVKRGKEVDKVIGTRHEEIRTKIEKYRA